MALQHAVAVLGLNLLCLLVLVGACTRPQGSSAGVSTATVPAPSTPNAALYELDASAIAAQLTSTDSLAQSAEQLAAAVAVPVDAIRVLIRTETCASCAATGGDDRAFDELTIAEATPLLEDGSSFWLNVPPLACLYTRSGAQIRPQGCRIQ